jgi:actin-related protein
LEKQQKLIEEEENRERVAQAKKESQKKKKDAKKQKRKQKQEEEVRVRAQQEAEARAKAEKEKQEKQEQQRKRDEEKRRVEEDRRKKEEEARKKRDEEQRKKDEAERKRREEEQRKKDEAERKRKEQEAHRQAQAQEDQAKADAQAKLQAERMLQQQQQAPVASVAVGLPQTASVALSESDGDSEPIKKKKNRRKQKKKNEVKEEQYIPGMNKLGAASASSKPKPDSSSIPGLATTMSAPVKTQAHPVSPREQNMAPPAPLVSEVNAELAPQIRVSKKPDPNAPAFQPRGKMPIHVPSPSAATAQWYGPFAGPAGQFPPGTIPPYGGARPPQANTYSTFTPTANPVPGASQPPAQPVRAKTAASSPVTGNTKYPVAPGQQAKSPAKGNTRYAPKSSQNGGHAPTNKPVDSVNTLDFETNMDLGSVGNLLPNSVISGLDAPSPAVAPAASPKPPSPPVYSSSPASSNAPSKLDPVVSTQSVLFNRGVVNAPGSRPATVANSPAGSPNPLTASTDSLALSRENFMLVSPAHQPPLHDTHNSTVPVISPIPTSTTSLLAEIRSDQDEVVTPKGRGFLPIDSSVPGSWATSKQQPFSKAISPSLPIGHAKPITNSPHIGPKPILINNDLGSFRPSITMDTSIWGDSLMSETMPSLQGGGFGGLPMPPAPASSNNHVSPGFSTAPGTGW